MLPMSGIRPLSPKFAHCWMKRVVRAGLHREHGVDTRVRDLPEVRAEVSRIERVPQLLGDLASVLREDLGQAAALLVPEGVVLADGRDLLEALLPGPVAERMRGLARRVPAM